MMNLSLRWYFLTIFLSSLLVSELWAKSSTRTFRETKQLARQIWQDHRQSFYCDCKYDRSQQVNFSSCHYHPQDLKRAKRIEWEHLVPVSWFARQRACWQQPLCTSTQGQIFSGRHCCEKIDAEFREMYVDLHNLVPAIGEVNKARANYRFVDNDEMNIPVPFNGCELTIDEAGRKVLPRLAIRGMIARAHLYMNQKYAVFLSQKQYTLMSSWNRSYPPSPWEIEWNRRIKAIDGSDNPFISGWKN